MKKYIFLILLAVSSVKSYSPYDHSCLETVAVNTFDAVISVTESVRSAASSIIGSAALGIGTGALSYTNPNISFGVGCLITGTIGVETRRKFNQYKIASGLKKIFTQYIPFVLGYCTPIAFKALIAK